MLRIMTLVEGNEQPVDNSQVKQPADTSQLGSLSNIQWKNSEMELKDRPELIIDQLIIESEVTGFLRGEVYTVHVSSLSRVGARQAQDTP